MDLSPVQPGCLLYQLVKNKAGDYFVLELYKDQAALDTHFNNMTGTKRGAIPLEKIKYEVGTCPCLCDRAIFAVCLYLHSIEAMRRAGFAELAFENISGGRRLSA